MMRAWSEPRARWSWSSTDTALRSTFAIRAAGPAKAAAAPAKVWKPWLPPMPGKVVRVLVAAGDMVEAGQGILVVEAMKMQNEMKASRAGRVAAMHTREGATVAAGEALATIE